jgi:hypothetical protein
MMFQKTIARTMLVIMMLCVSGHAMAAPSPDAGVDDLLELLSVKGVITVEEGSGLRAKSEKSAGVSFEAVVELLLSKGTINPAEAEALLKRKAAAKPDKPVQGDGAAVEAAAGPSASPDTTAKLPEKEIRPVLEILREQGVLGNDEAAQIGERFGRKLKAGDEEDAIAMADQEIEYNRSTLPKEVLLGNIVKLRHQGLINEDESERIKRRFLQKYAMERVTDSIGDNMKRDVQTQVADRIIPVPEWTRRISIGGDIRLRYQADFFDSGNALQLRPDKPTELMNTTVDQHHLKVRARLNFTAKITDDIEAVIGMATGNTTNPVSTNTTLGDSLNKKNFLIDLAYLKWQPFKELTLRGGRFPSPWFGSDLVWDPDINFDGIAFSYVPQLTPSLNLFLTGGAFPIQDVDLKSSGKWLFAGQLGLRYRKDEQMTATIAAAFYNFENTVGQVNTGGIDVSTGKPVSLGDKDWTAPQFMQKGNTLINIDPTGLQSNAKMAYAAEFRILHLAGALDLGLWDPMRVVLTTDYVNNIGFDSARVNALTGHVVKKETEGYQLGLSIGYPETRSFGQWKALLNYKYLEADAVMDAFAESDFHLGGTNAKGWIIGGDLGLAKNVWLSTRWLTTNEISGPPLAIDLFQLNLNAKF